MFNIKSKYYNSKEKRAYEQIFEAYFDPYNEYKSKNYYQLLKKNTKVRFLTRAFVYTFPFITGLYLLPGNSIFIQVEFKKIVRNAILTYYKILKDYSDKKQQEKYQKNYLLALNNHYFYFENQEIEQKGVLENIIKEYIFTLNENSQQLEFALLHLDQLLQKVIYHNRFNFFIEQSNLLIDLLDMIDRNLTKLDEKELLLKYQFESQKIQPITTLVCILLQYSLDVNERAEVYKYTINLLQKNIVLARQLKNQFHILMPIIYRDLARNQDELNIASLQFLNQLQQKLDTSDLLNVLMKDQLYSNLFGVLNKKKQDFKNEFLVLLKQTAQNKEICYLVKETDMFKEEKLKLQQLKISGELQSVIKQIIQ